MNNRLFVLSLLVGAAYGPSFGPSFYDDEPRQRGGKYQRPPETFTTLAGHRMQSTGIKKARNRKGR